MEAQQFDQIAKALVGASSRRHLLRGLAVGTAGSLFARFSPAPVEAQITCAPGLTPCQYRSFVNCKDLSSDPANCGTCNNSCYTYTNGTNIACVGGVCTVTCTPGSTSCMYQGKAVCADLSSDPSNCGACGNSCSANGTGSYCINGQCAASCPSGLTDCTGNGFCSDLSSDAFNCGACGVVCSGGEGGQGCSGGVCQCLPPIPLACYGGCVPSDEHNCGSCGNVCTAGQTCQGGVCTGGSEAGSAADQAYAIYLLPQAWQLPAGFVEHDDYTRTLSQEAAQFADPNAAQLLAMWGWRANAYRSFVRSGGGATFLDVSINLFSSDGTAAAASEYFVAHDQVANPSWAILPSAPRMIPSAGLPQLFSTVWLSGVDPSGGIGADLFLQIGQLAIRVGGIAPTGTPVPDMIALANTIMRTLAAGPD